MQALPLLDLVERAERMAADAAGTVPPRQWRLVRETSRRAWYAVRDILPKQQQAVFWGLMAYFNRHQEWPTAMELLEFLQDLRVRRPHHPRYRLITDVNSVRPRLSEINSHDPALVVTGPARLCTSRHEQRKSRHTPVLTWRIPQLGETARSGRPPHTKTEAA